MFTITSMITIMIQIYVLTCVGKESLLLVRIKEMMIYFVCEQLLKLNANCIINGLVYEESEKLLSVMDSIDISNTKADEQDFREAIVFMAMSREIKFGFTIGGFMPLRKTTLLSVRLENIF